MQMSAELAEPLVLAEAPLGARRILYAKGGSFSGPGLRGELLPGGGDWVLERRDGIAELDIRFVLRSEDGALIHVRCAGLFGAAPEVRQRLRAKEEVDPAEYYFRTAAFFETGAERYRRLNCLVAVGVGQRTRTGMVTEVFELK